MATGDSNAQVARALHVSEATVRKHLEHIFSRLDVASRTEAVVRVIPFLHVARAATGIRHCAHTFTQRGGVAWSQRPREVIT